MISNEENVLALIEAWKVMSGRLPGSSIDHSQGVATAFANVPLAFLNISTVDRPAAGDEDLRKLLGICAARAKACPHESMLALCEPWLPPDWERMAAEAGFSVVMTITGMAAAELLPARRPAPELEIRRVADETTARALATINSHAYGMDPELFECICNLHLWHEDSVGYVGYAGGRAVSCAATFPAAGSVYVALVATMPDVHGKGYAEAVMRKAIETGREVMGVSRSVLHASDMGHPLYRSMGFESGAVIKLLMPSATVAGH